MKVQEFINSQDLIRPIPPQFTSQPSPYSTQPSPSNPFISYTSPNRPDTSLKSPNSSPKYPFSSPNLPDTSSYRQVQYAGPPGPYSGHSSQYQGPVIPYSSPSSVFQSFPWSEYNPYLEDRAKDGYGQNSVRPFGPANTRAY